VRGVPVLMWRFANLLLAIIGSLPSALTGKVLGV